jgi:hypothetical protein
MALNPAKVGATYPTYRYEVAREKIREYATALGESDPRYTAEGDDCVAPPTFVAAFTITRGALDLFADPELGAHPALVHGSQRFVWHGRPLRPGDVLACTPRIASITARGRNEFLVIELDCVHEGSGEPALTAETTIVFLGSAPQDGAGEAAA